jgi:predicted alpha-1,2-mannosidase
MKNWEFMKPFDPFKLGEDFTEGNSWHYTWSVFHDVEGLIGLMGGREAFVQKLDEIFDLPPVFEESYYGFVIHEIREMQVANMGQYAHGNQPIQHMIYLYNYAGAPWKAQYWARETMDRMYKPTPDGYCGDEDNGQTSAWYVFSAMGFYPVCPGTDEYVIGSPLFKKVTVKLENDKTLIIEAPKNKKENRYVNKLWWNGQERTANWVSHQELMQGGILKFEMSDRANPVRGTGSEDFPYSLSKEDK